MALDVTSLNHRRAVHRWERVSVGDVLERLRWSVPDQEAIIGWAGAYASPEYARLSYRQADELASQVAHGLLGRGLHAGRPGHAGLRELGGGLPHQDRHRQGRAGLRAGQPVAGR